MRFEKGSLATRAVQQINPCEVIDAVKTVNDYSIHGGDDMKLELFRDDGMGPVHAMLVSRTEI